MTKNHTVTPYLFLAGRCEEAIEFYRQAVGAESLMIVRYENAPPEVKSQIPCPPNWIMHARLRIGTSTVMLADGPATGKFDGFALTLTAATPAEAEQFFAALSQGGKVEMPLAKTFFSPCFGMLTDLFGVKWMVIVDPPAAS